MGNDAANGERVLQPDDERDRFPGGNFAAAILQSERGRCDQLRRHWRGDRSRDDARFRRSRPAVRRRGKFARLVVARIGGSLQDTRAIGRRSIFKL